MEKYNYEIEKDLDRVLKYFLDPMLISEVDIVSIMNKEYGFTREYFYELLLMLKEDNCLNVDMHDLVVSIHPNISRPELDQVRIKTKGRFLLLKGGYYQKSKSENNEKNTAKRNEVLISIGAVATFLILILEFVKYVQSKCPYMPCLTCPF